MDEPISFKINSTTKRKIEALAKRQARTFTAQARKILTDAVTSRSEP